MNDTYKATIVKTVRRNGQLMSCEPCRRSRKRCDHGLPSCVRCRNRGKAAEAMCHYHPAPMTRSGKTGTLRLPARGSLTSESSSSSGNHTQSCGSSSTDSRRESIDAGTSLVCMDTALSPLLEVPASEYISNRAYTAITRTGIASPTFTASPALLAEGIGVLETLLDTPTALTLVTELWYSDWGDDACQGALVKASWQAVVETLLPRLRVDSSASAVSTICDSMFKRTSQPLRWPLSTANGALVQAFSAEGVRWETLGLYFALIGAVLGRMKEGPESVLFASGKWGTDRKSAMQRMLDSCLQCYRICEQMGQINDLTVWHLNLATMLTTWCYGDDSYQAWRLMGDLASVVVALGYHDTTRDDSHVPFYLQQFRKRALAGAHELDKGLATFVGRPPHLSRRYVGLDPPLDLPSSVIMGTPEALAAAIVRLDSNGWNTEGRVYPITRTRAVAMLIGIREEALELSFGPRNDDVNWRSRSLLARSAATWAAFPPHIKYEPSVWARHSSQDAMMLLMLRLEALYTDFILQKLVMNQDPSNRNMLIETSHLILSLVLSALNQRIALAQHRIDLEWTIVFHAMPCASVLILELMRQVDQPQQRIPISRSTLIQDLSVLISCCDWLTEPGQQNYSLCKRAQSIFSRSMDRILNAPMQPFVPPTKEYPPEDCGRDAEVRGPVALRQRVLVDEPEWKAWLEICNLHAEPWLDVVANSAQVGTDGSPHGGNE